MKFCQRCGCRLVDEAAYCPYCGVTCPPMYPSPDDAPSFLWGLLCCLIPILGLILYLVWRKEYPKRANSCGSGAIIGFALSIVIPIVLEILIFFLLWW